MFKRLKKALNERAEYARLSREFTVDRFSAIAEIMNQEEIMKTIGKELADIRKGLTRDDNIFITEIMNAQSAAWEMVRTCNNNLLEIKKMYSNIQRELTRINTRLMELADG